MVVGRGSAVRPMIGAVTALAFATAWILKLREIDRNDGTERTSD